MLFFTFSTESAVTGTLSHDCRGRKSLYGRQAALQYGATFARVDAPVIAHERGGHETSGRTAQARRQLVRSTHMRTRSEQDEDLESAPRVSVVEALGLCLIMCLRFIFAIKANKKKFEILKTGVYVPAFCRCVHNNINNTVFL